MPRDKPVLIDTSVWIDYLQKKDSPVEKVIDGLLATAASSHFIGSNPKTVIGS